VRYGIPLKHTSAVSPRLFFLSVHTYMYVWQNKVSVKNVTMVTGFQTFLFISKATKTWTIINNNKSTNSIITI
jgi:hypothetical protein